MARNPRDIRLLLAAAAVAFIYIHVRLFSTQSHDAGRLAEAEKCESQLRAMIDQVSAQQEKIAALEEMKVRQDEERVQLKILIQDLEKRSLQTLINKNVVPVAAVVIMACNRPDYLQRTVESILKSAMSAFTGVSVADGYKRCCCDTLAVDARGDSGYHLLMVNGYSRTKELIPTCQSITANSFMVGGHDWLIEYYPNGKNPSCAGFISLFLTLLYDADADDEEPVEVRFSFSLVDQVEKQMPTYIRGTGQTRSFSSTTPIWGNDRFLRRDALEQSVDLKCDCFTIRCDVVVIRNTKDDDASGRGGTAALLPDIHQHFNSLLRNKMGADVAFQLGGETFAAHRSVLAARSTVFMAQLFGPMKETSNVIHIKDMEPKVFTALLNFVYTDSFPDMYEDNIKLIEICKDTGQGQEDEMSEAVDQGQDGEAAEDEMGLLQWLQDLFVAADRYDLQQLKFICVKQLSQRIGVTSVASTLALAEQHHCRGLKEACLKFIQVQSPPCLQTLMACSGWGHIVTTYPSVLNELIAMLASNQRK